MKELYGIKKRLGSTGLEFTRFLHHPEIHVLHRKPMTTTTIREFVAAACLSLGILHTSATANDSSPISNDSGGGRVPTAPTGVAPLAGVAAILPKDVDDSREYAWSLRLSVPKVTWEIVGKERPKVEWSKVRADVEMHTMDIAMGHSGATQLSEESQDRVVDLNGKRLSREEAMKRLASDTPVMVSVSGGMPDPFYLRCLKPDTLVVIIGLPTAREYNLLPTARQQVREAEPDGG